MWKMWISPSVSSDKSNLIVFMCMCRGCSSSQLPAAGGTGGRSEGRWWWYSELGPRRRQRYDANPLDGNDHWPCQGEPPHSLLALLFYSVVGKDSSWETFADCVKMVTHEKMENSSRVVNRLCSVWLCAHTALTVHRNKGMETLLKGLLAWGFGCDSESQSNDETAADSVGAMVTACWEWAGLRWNRNSYLSGAHTTHATVIWG